MSADKLPSVFLFNINACNSSEFGCSNGICIPRFERCNMRSECSDGEDEKNCNSIVTPPGNFGRKQLTRYIDFVVRVNKQVNTTMKYSSHH